MRRYDADAPATGHQAIKPASLMTRPLIGRKTCSSRIAFEMNVGLPNAEQAYIEQAKITEYLLSPTSPSGKARFFQRFGFRLESWRTLQQALLRHGRENRNVRAVEMAFGVHYLVEGPLETPDGRGPLLRTVWSVESGSARC